MSDRRPNSAPLAERVRPADPDWGWPIGWVVTYLVGDPPGPDGSLTRVGVIARRAEQSATTGRVLIPVRALADPSQAVGEWVHESDVVKLCPPYLMDSDDPDPDLAP